MKTTTKKGEEIKEFEKGTFCYRCGSEKKEVRKMGRSGCSAWGCHYPRHMWNTNPVIVKTQLMTVKTIIK